MRPAWSGPMAGHRAGPPRASRPAGSGGAWVSSSRTGSVRPGQGLLPPVRGSFSPSTMQGLRGWAGGGHVCADTRATSESRGAAAQPQGPGRVPAAECPRQDCAHGVSPKVRCVWAAGPSLEQSRPSGSLLGAGRDNCMVPSVPDPATGRPRAQPRGVSGPSLQKACEAGVSWQAEGVTALRVRISFWGDGTSEGLMEVTVT